MGTPSVLERLPGGARIAVIRLRSLGDSVLTTPAIALLKAHRPDLSISVIVEPQFAGVFEDNPDVAEIRSTACRADLVLNLHGGTRSIAMTLASRARFRAGFEHHVLAAAYNVKIPRAQVILGVERKVHTAEHLASAIFYLGVPVSEIPRARLYAAPPPDRRPYVVLHPFASALGKTWPADRFVALAEALRNSLEPVFLAGPSDDVSPFSRYEVVQARPLSEVKSLSSGARLFVGNDSGPAHMAAAFGVPVLAMFGSSDPQIWSPWRTKSKVLAPAGGITAISVDDALAAVDTLLARQNEVHRSEVRA